MASTRAQQAEILRNQTYLDQLTGSLLAAATAVLNEGSTVADHANRLAYARAIVQNPAAQAAFFAPATMTNSTLVSEAGNAAGASGTPFADTDVDACVASLFNVFADQYAAQQTIGAFLQIGS